MTATAEKKRAPFLVEFYRSAVGKKWIMALTGIALILFLVAHMIGNWKIFFPDVDGIPEIDLYAEALRSLFFPIVPEYVMLWILRTGLIVIFGIHIHAAYALTVSTTGMGPHHRSADRYCCRWSDRPSQR